MSNTNGLILLANLLQNSNSTFSCVSVPSFFAFQEGMWDIQISALPSSPTVSVRILLANSRNPHSCVGGNHDKSEVPGSAGKFANSIRSFDATRGKSLGKVSNPREK